MFVVAILDLAPTAAEAEAIALAADLGVTAYELRLILSAGTPAVVLQTPDKERALFALGRIRGRGVGAVACDDAAVASSEDMLAVRDFALEPGALREGGGATLPYDDVLALVMAVHKRRTETQTETRDRKFRPFAAMASGGLVLTKSVVKVTRERTDDKEHVLYVYRRDAEPPWIFFETATRYGGLPGPLAPSQHENFMATVQALRARAPRAGYDERLLTIRRVPERPDIQGGLRSRTVTDSSAAGTDLLAHLVALWLARQSHPHR